MAELPDTFTQNDAGSLDDFSPIPAGVYAAEIVHSEIKTTQAGTGRYLSLRFKILDEDYAGRMVFTNINFENPNPTTVEIAQKTINTIKNVTGVLNLSDTDQLHGRPMRIKVTIRKSDEYGDSNEIKAYYTLEESDESNDDPF